MKLTTSWQTIESYVWNHSSGAKVTFYLEAKYSSQSIETNKSYIDTRLRSVLNVGSISGSGYNFTCSYCPTVSGSGVWNFDTETITSKSNQEIEHNPDGTKSLTLTASFSNSYHGLNKTISGTVELPTIPRASSVSSSSPYIGDSATIIISSASSSFTHTLTYAFGSASGTIATKTNLTTVPWDTNAIKSSLYAQIPNAKSGTGTITCQTYSGDTLVGTKTCSFNLYAKESDCKPSISGSVVDTNSSTIALTGNSAVMVRYMSKPKVTISATANYSSSIKSYSINVDGQTSNSSEATFDTISSNNITISVTDSRGYSNSTTLKPSMIDYVKLTSNLTIERPEQTSNEAYLNGSGQWFNGNFSDSNTNTLTITCQYRKSGDTDWIDLSALTPTISGNTFSFSNLKLGDSFDYKEEYQFRITIADKLQTIGNQTKDIVILSTGKAIVRIGKEKVIVNGSIDSEKFNGKLLGDSEGNHTGNINGYKWDIGTNNTTDTWVPVITSDSIQHREIGTIFGADSSAFSRAGSGDGINFDTVGSGLLFRSGLYSLTDTSGAWYNLINVRHRNGSGDGSSYGMQIVKQLTNINSEILTRSQSVSWSSWETIPRFKVLYDNSSGSNGTITLNESSTNFAYLEIFFKENTDVISSVRVASPNGKVVSLTSIENTDNYNYYMNIKSANVSISGSSITKTYYKETNINNAGGVTCSNSNNIYITKVLGWR